MEEQQTTGCSIGPVSANQTAGKKVTECRDQSTRRNVGCLAAFRGGEEVFGAEEEKAMATIEESTFS